MKAYNIMFKVPHEDVGATIDAVGADRLISVEGIEDSEPVTKKKVYTRPKWMKNYKVKLVESGKALSPNAAKLLAALRAQYGSLTFEYGVIESRSIAKELKNKGHLKLANDS